MASRSTRFKIVVVSVIAAFAIAAAAVGGYLLSKPADETAVPISTVEDIKASQSATDYLKWLDRISGQMVQNAAQPKSLEKITVRLSRIQASAIDLSQTLVLPVSSPSGDSNPPSKAADPSADLEASRKEVKAALRQIALAANQLGVSNMALSKSAKSLKTAQLASASDEASADALNAAELAAGNIGAVSKAKARLRRARQLLLKAKAAILRVLVKTGIEGPQVRRQLKRIEKAASTRNGRYGDIEDSLAESQQQLIVLAEDLVPGPVFTKCGPGPVAEYGATDPVANLEGAEPDPCTILGEVQRTYFLSRKCAAKGCAINVASLGTYYCPSTIDLPRSEAGPLLILCTYQQDPDYFVRFSVGDI